MSSILTNSSAMNALSTLRNVNSNLNETQNRISTGLKVQSGKDNASYFQISTTMSSESGMNKAVNEGLTLAKNSVSTARLGAESMKDLAQEFVNRIAFAQNDGVSKGDVQKELDSMVSQMETAIGQSSFNGENLVFGDGTDTYTATTVYDPANDTAGTIDSISAEVSVASGVKRDADGALGTTVIKFDRVDLNAVKNAFAEIDVTDDTTTMAAKLKSAEEFLATATTAATSLGVAEKAIETQQDFLGELTKRLDEGVGSMVDANMEQEAARLQALQVQQQLATQSLSIANQAPQNILSLFR